MAQRGHTEDTPREAFDSIERDFDMLACAVVSLSWSMALAMGLSPFARPASVPLAIHQRVKQRDQLARSDGDRPPEDRGGDHEVAVNEPIAHSGSVRRRGCRSRGLRRRRWPVSPRRACRRAGCSSRDDLRGEALDSLGQDASPEPGVQSSWSDPAAVARRGQVPLAAGEARPVRTSVRPLGPFNPPAIAETGETGDNASDPTRRCPCPCCS